MPMLVRRAATHLVHRGGRCTRCTSLPAQSRWLGTNSHDSRAGFDPREATIASVHRAIFSGSSTCRQVVSAFLCRIEALNGHVNAIISMNPRALDIADELDRELVRGNARGSLFGVPILLKDNFDTADMPTTGGCLALRQLQPSKDARVVVALKRAGAVVLGKTNLHEMALEGLSISSLGGQTINPYDHTRTPGGSSGGSAAALAMSFAVLATGTDTVNSLRNPASANSLVSVRPTRGLISRAGVIPVSRTQDTIGPMARNVEDLACALTVMASLGPEEADSVASLAYKQPLDYSAALGMGSLDGLRLGLLEGFVGKDEQDHETAAVNAAMKSFIAELERQGGSVVRVDDAIYDADKILAELDTQRYEYREALDGYLCRDDLGGVHPDSFATLYGGNEYLVTPAQYEYIQTAAAASSACAAYEKVKAGIARLTTALKETFSKHALDAIVYPQQRRLVVEIGAPSQARRNGILAALTGFPVVTLPVGFSPRNASAPRGVPIGMEVLGTPWSETRLLQIAHRLEGITQTRRSPCIADLVVQPRVLHEVPVIVPTRPGMATTYPIGVH